MKIFVVLISRLLAGLTLLGLMTTSSLQAGESISLVEAIARTLEKNPSLAAFDAEKRIAEARIISALERPNPELQTEIEDVLGGGQFEEFDSAVYNVGISQLIETGRKRKLRGELARAESTEMELEFQIAKRELISTASQRFVAVLSSQLAEENARQDLRIATDTYRAIQQQIEGGRGSAIDSGQALIGKNEAELALETASLKTQLACQQLSALWASPEPDFDTVAGDLPNPSAEIPPLDSLSSEISSHPLIEAAVAGLSSANARLSLEEKKRRPDLTAEFGYRRDSTVADNALVLGFSVPLPLFNRNRGGIAEAEASIDQKRAMVFHAETQLKLRIAAARAQLAAAKMAYDLVQGEMLPAASKQYETLSEGFSLGRIKYLEMLEGRRSLNSVRKQRVEALSAYHIARVELEAITGRKL
jgi:cobalt-zinc-cadmium efflux system outer membrane protein